MSILVSILLSLIGFVCSNISLFLHNLYFISISSFMCHAYFMVSEKNSDSVCMYAFYNAYSFYVHWYSVFPSGLNVVFDKCNGWQSYQMIKNIYFNYKQNQFGSFMLIQKIIHGNNQKNDYILIAYKQSALDYLC